MKMNKTGIIIQARMESTRLPGKVMLGLAGKTVLWHIVERCRKANVDKVIVATTTAEQDDPVVKFCRENDYDYFRGSEEDVLGRYYRCATEFELDVIIRVTSDCPLIDHNILNELIGLFKNNNCDYASNIIKMRTYPKGYDCEIFSFNTLEQIWKKAKSRPEREHIIYHIFQNQDLFKICQLNNGVNYSNYRLTLDEEEDFNLIREIFNRLFEKIIFMGEKR
jgi:spore coat polysaccharide biosynthesis protein SpsF